MYNKKRTFISLLVISTVFCISCFFNNLYLPSSIQQWKEPKASDTLSQDSVSPDSGIIHSLSYHSGVTDTFNIDEYLAMKEPDNEPLPAETVSETTPEAAPTEENNETDRSPATVENLLAAKNTDSDGETKAEKDAEEQQPESKYSDIGISVAKDYVNIRKEPNTDSDVLGKLYHGSAATITGTKGDWFLVESGSVTGYIMSDFLKTDISDDELIADYGTINILVDVDGLNVRKEPDIDAKKVTVIYKNEKYPVLETNDDWILIDIEDENSKGYVKKEFTELLVTFRHAVSKEEEKKILQLQAEERARKETEVQYNSGVNYTADDLKLLASLVHAEAGSENYECKLAVANIVLNRMKSSKYPSSMKAVVYQKGQFSVAASGSLQKQLNRYNNYSSKAQLMSVKAARDALEGANNIGKRLYFHTYSVAVSKGYTNKSNSVKLDGLLLW